MDLEEIEDSYKRNCDLADNKFIEGINEKRNFNELEKEYKDKLNNARIKYNGQISIYLRKYGVATKKIVKNGTKEKQKRFVVKSGNYELSYFQKARFKFSLIFFKIRFKLRNSIKGNIPNVILYNYLKIKVKVKKLKLRIKNFAVKIYDSIIQLLQTLLEYVKNLIKKLENVKNLPNKIIGHFIKKKSKTKDGEKVKEESNNKDKNENKD